MEGAYTYTQRDIHTKGLPYGESTYTEGQMKKIYMGRGHTLYTRRHTHTEEHTHEGDIRAKGHTHEGDMHAKGRNLHTEETYTRRGNIHERAHTRRDIHAGETYTWKETYSCREIHTKEHKRGSDYF